MEQKSFFEQMKVLLDEFAHDVYRATRTFPREEIYGITSQLRRASLSVVLNYIEGYARQRDKVFRNFVETSYGSLQESKYLIDFAFKEGYMDEQTASSLKTKAERAGGMLWGVLQNLKSDLV